MVLVLVISGTLVVLNGSGAVAAAQSSPITAASKETSSCIPSACYQNLLSSVSCPSSTFCTAVGQHYNAGSSGYTNIATLIEQWNGSTWSVVPSPNPSPGEGSLLSVSCASRTFCVAVGQTQLSTGNVQLIERWNGTTWSIVKTSGHIWAVNSVACSSASHCIAAGYGKLANGTTEAVVELWNGTTWSDLPFPETVINHAVNFTAVGCAERSPCFLLGDYAKGYDDLSFVEKSNGSSWVIEDSDNPGSGNDIPSALSCASARLCFAAGWYNNVPLGFISEHLLIERWNGSSWISMTVPNHTSRYNAFSGVSCASAKLCFAVGDHGSNNSQGLIVRWNGSSWSKIKSPFITGFVPGFVQLDGVTCISTSSCFAVGHFPNGSGTWRTLIEYWNGSTWSFVDSPNFSG